MFEIGQCGTLSQCLAHQSPVVLVVVGTRLSWLWTSVQVIGCRVSYGKPRLVVSRPHILGQGVATGYNGNETIVLALHKGYQIVGVARVAILEDVGAPVGSHPARHDDAGASQSRYGTHQECHTCTEDMS